MYQRVLFHIPSFSRDMGLQNDFVCKLDVIPNKDKDLYNTEYCISIVFSLFLFCLIHLLSNNP